jgi:hypothetical protein
MQIELTRTERRLLLQGIWKEADMYSNMLKEEARLGEAIDHCKLMLETLDKLEAKLLNW